MTPEQEQKAMDLQLAARRAVDEALVQVAAIIYVAVARTLFEKEGLPTDSLDALVPRK